jgi:hypothetical protein
MIVFEFKTDQNFKKAQDVLVNAIDKIVSPHFDHSIQPAKKTITVIDEKNAKIVEGLFKQKNIEFSTREDMSWIGPKKTCISGILRQASTILAGKLQKIIDKAKKQQDKPSVFLGGSCDDNNAWRKNIKEEFGDYYFFVDPYDPDWDPEENIYEELAAILNVDHVVFYQGGKGSEKEKKFMDNADKDYKSFENLDDLKDHLKAMAEHVNL